MMNNTSLSFIPQDHTIVYNKIPYVSDVLKPLNEHRGVKAIHWTPTFKYVEQADGSNVSISTEEDFNTWVKPYVYLLDTVKEYEDKKQRERFQDYNYCTQQLKAYRDYLLKETDFAVMPDYPITSDSKQSVEIYRQALRDITRHPEYPWKGTPTKEIPWPIKPTIVKKPSLGDN